jgi:hypothetical protein
MLSGRAVPKAGNPFKELPTYNYYPPEREPKRESGDKAACGEPGDPRAGAVSFLGISGIFER